ncbi:MAG TPA: protein-L-isoaspartate(D-aspartate) O-methyltransferase [Thermoanaerobaculia bacterium]|nr:protein-L-isoaspartate(D-aspartate) O-methyltransferase [Thermoanaerobaculia bacterium]
MFHIATFALILLAADPFAAARTRMVNEIAEDVRFTARETGRMALDRRVMDAMRTTPRHLFVPDELRGAAYQNRPLPIGHGQTISQPYIVALMTDLLRTKRTDVVLEVGTGSAYQAAVLSPLVKHVYTVEIIAPLAQQATARLRSLGYRNVTARHADGYNGWKEHAPFDAIIVTAAATHIPPPLIRQLKPGGRMIIPVGGPFATQSLMLVEKTAAGKVRTRSVLPVQFVPLTRPK